MEDNKREYTKKDSSKWREIKAPRGGIVGKWNEANKQYHYKDGRKEFLLEFSEELTPTCIFKK